MGRADGGLSVVFRPTLSPGTSASTGGEIVACVSEAIQRELPDIQLVPAEEFVRTAFPGLAPEEAPLSRESLVALLADAAFRERLTSLQVRYVVLVGGTTAQPKPEGFAVCSYGCLGLWVWKRETAFTASIFDLAQGTSLGGVEAGVTGRPWFAVIGIFPLGMPSFTESWACKKLARGVAEFLRETERRRP